MMIGLSSVLLIGLEGCVSRRNTKIIIRPTLDQDYHAMRKGTTYTAPLDGHFITDDYLQDAYDASIEEVKSK